jgi:hypothetical protein
MSSKVAWLVPTPLEGSGGHRTIFSHIQNLIARGHECDAYVHVWDSPLMGRGDAAVRSMIQRFYGPVSCGVRSGFELVGDYDLAVATVWWSAPIVAAMPASVRKAYFVQDYEASFEAVGDGHLLAQESYRLGLAPLTIGRWLSSRMVHEYGMPSNWFDFSADTGTYFDAGRAREDAVCFVYQPEKPRRCPKIGLEALAEIRRQRPRTKIYTYGSANRPDVPFPIEHLGLLNRDACAELYNRCSVGLCLSATNPSRIPYEMMACGLPVVDLYGLNTIYDLPDDATLLARPTPAAVSTALLRLLDDQDERTLMGKAGRAHMSALPAELEFSQAGEFFDDLLAGRPTGRRAPQHMYHAAPVEAGPGSVGTMHAAGPIGGPPRSVARRAAGRVKRAAKVLRNGVA